MTSSTVFLSGLGESTPNARRHDPRASVIQLNQAAPAASPAASTTWRIPRSRAVPMRKYRAETVAR
jgi:hypothetical protein